MSIKSGVFSVAKNLGLKDELIILNLKVKQLFGIKHNEFARLQSFYQQFVKKGSLVFDIGANVGNRTEVFLSLGAKVVAVDPNERMCRIQRIRFRGKAATILNNGIGERQEFKDFFVGSNSLVSSFSSKFIKMKQNESIHDNWKKKVVIELRTLDQIIEEFGMPDFCKIDVEGYEKQVLSGLSRPVPNLSFEFTSPDFNDEAIWCVTRLSEVGFAAFNISLKESLQFEFDTWIKADAMITYLRDSDRMKEQWYGDIYARI